MFSGAGAGAVVIKRIVLLGKGCGGKPTSQLVSQSVLERSLSTAWVRELKIVSGAGAVTVVFERGELGKGGWRGGEANQPS